MLGKRLSNEHDMEAAILTYAQSKKGDCACSKKLTTVGQGRVRSAGGGPSLASGRKRKRGAGGEANFNCVTIEFDLKIEFFLNQSLRLLDLILRAWVLNNFERDFDRHLLNAHAPARFYQPG